MAVGSSGPESGEAPRHVGGLVRGAQGGPQIVLLGGLDLVAGQHVEVVGEADTCHIAEPSAGSRRGALSPGGAGMWS